MLQAMYLPPQFKGDRAQAAALITEHPFASLISIDDAGLPYVTHLPLHLEERGEQLVLLGHVAKPNPHWRYLQARPQAVVTFLGPHAYLSPKVYPDLARVPTWNYLAVHCTVQATLIEDPWARTPCSKTDRRPRAALCPAVARPGRGVRPQDAGRHRGFELQVTDFQCKVKINQHRRESHAAMNAMYAAGNEDERALAAWMDRLGMAAGNDTPKEA
jgi:transcriptional regulator